MSKVVKEARLSHTDTAIIPPFFASQFASLLNTFYNSRNSLHSLPLPQVPAGQVTTKPVRGDGGGGQDLLLSLLHLLPRPLLLPPALRSHLRLQP